MKPRCVWLTRAEPAVQAQRQLLDERGVYSIIEPLMYIEGLAEAQLLNYRAAMTNFAAVDYCIFISANAVSQLLALLTADELLMLRQKQVFAVGKATQQALSDAGIEALAPSLNTSSEALLELAELQLVSGKSIVIFRGVGGRGYLQQQLAARGAVVNHIEIYRRSAPSSLSPELLDYYGSGNIDVVFIGSTETFDNLLKLIPHWSKTIDMVVPSQRVAQYIELQGYARVHVSTTAHNTDMVATACALL